MDNTKKKRKQLALGSFFQPKPRKNPDGTIHQTIIPSVASDSACHERSIKCKAERYKLIFVRMQGLGSHLNICQYYKEDIKQDQDLNLCKIVLPNVLITDASGRVVNPRNRQMAATMELEATEYVTKENRNTRKDGELDGRMRNRGSSNRTVYSSENKWNHIEQFETWFDQKKDKGEPSSITAYIHENRLPIKFKKFLSTKSSGWRDPRTKEAICMAVTDKVKKKLAVPARCRKYASKYPVMEGKLRILLNGKRSRKARVSSLWIRTTAKKLAIEHYPDSHFKASNGWLFRFLRRHRIRFRKHKNQKSVSAEGKGSSYKNGIRRSVMKYNLLAMVIWELTMVGLGDFH